MWRIKYTSRPGKTTRPIRGWWWILPLLWIVVSCNKNEEPPRPVGQAVPFTGAPNRTLRQLLDSIPNLTIYDSIYRHSDLGHFLDSLSKAGAGGMNTLFAPTDQAFQSAGINLAQMVGLSPAVLDSIVYYLAAPGSYTTQAVSALQGGLALNTLLIDPAMQRTYPNPNYSGYSPYIYPLVMGWSDGTLLLNGSKVTPSGATGLPAIDGVLWLVDTLVQKPALEAYQVIAADTSFSFYLAACRISDSIYSGNYVYFQGANSSAPDTVYLQMQQGMAARTYFVPTNNAFRKAGFLSVQDISTYIDQSVCAYDGGYQYTPTFGVELTNLDSILIVNQTPGMFYSADILVNPSINRYIQDVTYDGQPDYFMVNFSNVNGQVVMHRKDFPSGRAATVVAPHDITVLNGVVHAVDNLLTPQP